MVTEDEKTFSRVLFGLAENTGMHGLPNIRRSKSLFRKLFWLLILCAGLSFMIWQLIEAFKKYYSRPTDTNIETGTKTALEFPAVTICNLNPMRLSALADAGEEFQSLFGGEADGEGDWDIDSTAPPDSFFDWDEQDNIDNYYEQEDSEFTAFEAYLDLAAELTIDQLVQYGHQIEWMLLDCSFLGKECSPRNFTRFYNPIYGNCYTFNAGDQNTTLMVSKVGPLYGLTLKLFIQQGEYVEGLADAAGARVTIHNKSSMPFPEDEGFSVSPGALTYVGLERVEIGREDPPHGDCENVNDEQNQLKNLWRSLFTFLDYTSQACKKTCYQLHVIENCNCSDSDFLNWGTAVDHVTGVANSRVRPCRQDEEVTCLESIEDKFQNAQLNCTAHCKKECTTVEYNRHLSYARWPSEAKEEEELETLLERDQSLYDALYESNSNTEYLRKNILKLKIYFKNLDYTSIVTKASYGIVDLLSDVGGQVGLWLGLSVITVFEFVELVWDVCTLCLVHQKIKAAEEKSQDDENRSTVGLQDYNTWSSTTKISLHGASDGSSSPDSKMPDVNKAEW